MGYAPVTLFVFNRPEHTRRLLQSLLKNPELGSSPFTIFCDGPRGGEDEEMVQKTRAVVEELAPSHATTVFRKENRGLAASIIQGVSETVDTHGKVIVFEDDLILSPGTLGFLNQALERYENEDRVAHVSAYMFPVKSALPELFFYREATCWGWATWKRAWDGFETDAQKLLERIEKKGLKGEFDINNTMPFFKMLKKQAEGGISSWAIRWYASNFLKGGLSLHPGRSLTFNAGFDGTGVHCTVTKKFDVEISNPEAFPFPSQIEESQEAVTAMMAYRSAHKKPKLKPKRARVLSPLKRLLKI